MSKKPTLIAYAVKERSERPERHLDADRLRQAAWHQSGLHRQITSALPSVRAVLRRQFNDFESRLRDTRARLLTTTPASASSWH